MEGRPRSGAGVTKDSPSAPSRVTTPRRGLVPRPDLDRLDLVAFESLATTAAIASYAELRPVVLGDSEVSRSVDFLLALTDPSALDPRQQVPRRVPSGLPLAEIR
jgi:cytochrome c peroxidase